jgi:flagellar basal body rod protein FlgC
MQPAMNMLSIAASGMSAAVQRLDVAAQNTVANTASDFAPPAAANGAGPASAPSLSLGLVQFSLPGGGVGTEVQTQGPEDPVMDIVGQMQALEAFKANARVFEAGEKTLDTLLDLKA